MPPSKIKVMVVDDSAVVRQVASEILGQDPQIEVLGVAADPIFALAKMEREWPDVIVLDIEMPRMDGISFLTKIMQEHPTPVVICSSLAESGSDTMQRAIAAGAVEIITKPRVGVKGFLHESGRAMIDAVKAAGQARLRPMKAPLDAPEPKLDADAVLRAGTALGDVRTTELLVALGTSTGGTQALERVLTRLPRVCPGIVIVQHMPEKFTEAFAKRLDSLCAISVKEARNRDRILPGQALIAPGGHHMVVRRSGAQLHVEVLDGPLVNRHRPSVDVLFRSVAQCAGPSALGIIMTGMGDDGARGLLEMRKAGARTLAQDEDSCVVYGMPREAVKLGASEKSLTLDLIPKAITEFHR